MSSATRKISEMPSSQKILCKKRQRSKNLCERDFCVWEFWNAHKLKLYAFLNKKSISDCWKQAPSTRHLSRIFFLTGKKCATTCEEFKEFLRIISMSFCLNVCVCAKGQKVPLKKKVRQCQNAKRLH
jgi:hypothetical protein